MNRLKLKLKRAALKSAAATSTDPVALARNNLKIGRNFYDEGDYPNAVASFEKVLASSTATEHQEPE